MVQKLVMLGNIWLIIMIKAYLLVWVENVGLMVSGYVRRQIIGILVFMLNI